MDPAALRALPGVDRILSAPGAGDLLDAYPRGLVVAAARAILEEWRARLSEGEALPEALRAGALEPWVAQVAPRCRAMDRRSLRPVINATGVVLHTNLGRAPLPPAALDALRDGAGGYSNLEFDLGQGARGSRYVHCTDLLRELTGAPAALVVNNTAAGLVLALNTLARGRGVAVSRGELVEIGGGFRIPEMLDRSGSTLVEVGTTNRTRIGDYRDALADPDAGVAALLKVHRSNFRVEGFTEEASLEDLVDLGRRHGVPVVHDLGSGLLADPVRLGLPPEPRARESLAAGADVVIVSGDKLLGGPQAGILLGSPEAVSAMRKNPLCRALRVDKLTLCALEATLRLYRDEDQALREIPALRALALSPRELGERAEAWKGALDREGVPAEVGPGASVVGGGTYPGVTLETRLLRLEPPHGRTADSLAGALRAGEPPVVGRVEDGAVVLDPRTVLPGEEEALLRRVVEVWGG